jgi:NAD(P)-dependent dehydrogenase (short-subunit alcohol dehydrogenase family)
MTLRHNTVSPVEPTELRPAPGSFLNPIERVTYRPSRTPSFAQPIDANRYFDAPSLQPEGRRSGGLKYGAAYSASKWGIIGLMKSAALELGQYKITVNAIVPGLIDTPLLDSTRSGRTGPGRSTAALTAIGALACGIVDVDRCTLAPESGL